MSSRDQLIADLERQLHAARVDLQREQAAHRRTAEQRDFAEEAARVWRRACERLARRLPEETP